MRSTFSKKYILALLIIMYIGYPADAFAYIDPGIGGMFFQIGYIVFTGFVLSIIFWLKSIKKFFQKIIQYIKIKND